MEIRQFQETDRAGVLSVWVNSGITRPWNNPDKDIDRKVAVDPNGFLVALQDSVLVGTVMAGYDGHRGWIQYMAVDPGAQRGGIGRALMDAAVGLLRERGCPKINLQVRRDNEAVVDFYTTLGFVEDDVLSMGFRLEADE
ncbi:MAG TPA: GNAT family acetyltransferase [Fimbriimonadaceae bacterium]